RDLRRREGGAMSLAIDLYMNMLAQRRKQGRLVTLLSAVILILKFSDITVEKIAVAGSEVTIKQPFVITGAIAMMLLYNAIRHVNYVFGIQALGGPYRISKESPTICKRMLGSPNCLPSPTS